MIARYGRFNMEMKTMESTIVIIQPNKTYDLLSMSWDEIVKLTNNIVTKILEHYGFTSEYVTAHPDEFSIIHDPGIGIRDVTDTFVLMHRGTTLATYTIHSCFNENDLLMTFCVSYTLGGDS